jgi:putative endonuclease
MLINRPPFGLIYIGVASDLAQGAYQHQERSGSQFAGRYNVTRLVWYELHDTMEQAIVREKRLKRWNRDWKLREIREMNPTFRDLYEDLA